MNLLRRLITEAHRRSLWQVLGIYLVGAWIGYQVILNVMQGFGLPDWVAPFSLVLFLIGLPIVIATAFVQEGLPEKRDFVRADPHDIIPGFSTAADEMVPAPIVAERDRPSQAAGVHRHLTWPKAILGGVAAFLVLGFSTAGYMGMRTAGIGPMGTLLGKGELSERDAIVLAQFTSAGDDSLLVSAVTEAFRVDFEQSPIVRVVGPQQVADVLRRMQRDANATVDEALAREIAEREGFKAVLSGEVNQVGSGYVLSARLLAVDGRVLVSARETALDSTSVLAAIDALSETLRERIGESLRTIRANHPLEQVTTSSLEALRKYSQADRARNNGDVFRAIELLEQAVEIDPGFAMAWRKLAAIRTGPTMDRDLLVEAATRAFELRDRLTQKEAHLAAAAYYAWVVGDNEAAAREYRSLLDVQPDETTALNNLANILAAAGEFEEAVALSKRGVEIGGSITFYNNHAAQLWSLNRRDEAFAVLERARAVYPDNPGPQFITAVLHAAAGDLDRADSIATEARTQRLEPTHRNGYLWLAASIDAVRGRRAEALEHARALERESRALSKAEALYVTAWRGELMLALGVDTAAAIAEVENAMRLYPLDEMHPLQRPYGPLAAFFTRAGRGDRAAALLAQYEAAVPASQRGDNAVGIQMVRAALLAQRGDPAAAEVMLDEAYTRGDCDICALEIVAHAYARAGDRTRAIETYERYLETPFPWRTGESDAAALATVLQELAMLYEDAGNSEAAARTYGRFVELWRDADPALQPRVRAARERLEAIVQRRG